MKPVTIRNLTIGTGLPKVCVPVVGVTLDEIRSQAAAAAACCPDIVEWRGDWFQDITDFDQLEQAFQILRGALGDIPLLYTFRTAAEGGERELPISEYCSILNHILAQKLADIVDIELYLGDDIVTGLIANAHAASTPVILSNHDFGQTPDAQDLLSRLHKMETLGCDIAKIAMMPQSNDDVLTILNITNEYFKTAHCPLITMSMTQRGLISRLCGNLIGSALTFGTAGKASAPGQIPAAQLRDLLEILQI